MIGYDTNFIDFDDSEENVRLTVKDLILDVIPSDEELLNWITLGNKNNIPCQ